MAIINNKSYEAKQMVMQIPCWVICLDGPRLPYQLCATEDLTPSGEAWNVQKDESPINIHEPQDIWTFIYDEHWMNFGKCMIV